MHRRRLATHYEGYGNEGYAMSQRPSSIPPSRLRLVEEPYEEVGEGDGVELFEELTDDDVIAPGDCPLYFGIKLPLVQG